ncbi:MAG: methyltransferase domain-containing protein, partial [Planctomycetota bacterium]|nr:methyltransferase domain-containing protein [Planctomycetota bacterium]
PWREPIESPDPFGYRAKTFLIPQRRAALLVLGARPPRGQRLVDTSGCAVLRPELEELARHIRQRLAGETALAGPLRSILLRCNRAGRTQVTLVHRGERPGLRRFRFKTDALFAQRHDAEGNRIHSDEPERLLHGDGPIREQFGPVAVALAPTAFMQGNPAVAEALYHRAAAALDGPCIAELFCGGGAAGLWALHERPNATLVGVDRSPRSIALARDNAERNGLAERCTFECGRAEDAGGQWDSVLVNPPRAGVHERVLQAIAASRARTLVYLSCNPKTLARDRAALGWDVVDLVPADMFPQTPHLEILAVLARPRANAARA